MKRLLSAAIAIGLVWAAAVFAETGPAPKGKGEITVKTGKGPLPVFTYKPARFSSGPVLFVFHGQKRNADKYRDYTIPLAEKMGAMVAAPCFGEDVFPGAAYAQGKIVRDDGSLQPKKEWSFTAGSEVVRAVLAREGNPRRSYFFLGHSAGGQFLVRFTAVEESQAQRVIVANPGTYVFPRADRDWPYGFGKLPAELDGEKNIRRFLAAPLTVLLGQADTNNSTEAGNFPATPEANLQGAQRLDRGRNFFEAGQTLAREKGWPFGWKKLEVPGVAHDGNLMINSLEMEKELLTEKSAPDPAKQGN